MAPLLFKKPTVTGRCVGEDNLGVSSTRRTAEGREPVVTCTWEVRPASLVQVEAGRRLFDRLVARAEAVSGRAPAATREASSAVGAQKGQTPKEEAGGRPSACPPDMAESPPHLLTGGPQNTGLQENA